MNRMLLLLAAGAAAPSAAIAQLSITTIGATDAFACYENARDGLSEDTTPCDAALADRGTSRNDRKKTLVNRGILFNRKGDLNEALSDFNRAIEIDEDLAEAYVNRGNTWFYAGDYDRALADYERSLTLDVAKPWAAWYNIGLVHDARNDAEAAQEAYAKSLALNPEFYQAQQKIKP